MYLYIINLYGMIIYSNGQFISDTAPIFKADNRAFHYGDGIFETMLCKNNSIQYFSDHFVRLQKSMLCMDLTNSVCSNETELKNIIHELICVLRRLKSNNKRKVISN